MSERLSNVESVGNRPRGVSNGTTPTPAPGCAFAARGTRCDRGRGVIGPKRSDRSCQSDHVHRAAHPDVNLIVYRLQFSREIHENRQRSMIDDTRSGFGNVEDLPASDMWCRLGEGLVLSLSRSWYARESVFRAGGCSAVTRSGFRGILWESRCADRVPPRQTGRSVLDREDLLVT